MNILELDSFNLADTVKFHDRLNPRLWDRSEHLRPEVHAKLVEIARDFQEFLGVPDLDVKDITISGSNAAYNYTPTSDIDLHLVVDLPEADNNEVYRELFDAKKFQYNNIHNIKIGGYDVELYVQNPNEEHHSQGIYSLLRNAWVSVPKRRKAEIDDISTKSKYEDLAARIDDTVSSGDHDSMAALMKKIKAMRQNGLDKHGELGADNLAFKMLRNNGYIKKLVDARNAARDHELSLAELAKPRQRITYGYVSESPDGVDPTTKMFLEEPVDESPDGVNPTTAMFVTEDDNESTVREFIDFVADRLGITQMPAIELHSDPEWSKQNKSFGRYTPETHTLEVNLANRHIMDILRTTAHELVHCRQNQERQLPNNAGATGSKWENQAHAIAGVIMRDYAEHNPTMFENASGYIPKNKKEARDPRYSMAVSVDIKPGQVGKEANKLALNTGRNGEPGLLMKSANLRESFDQPYPLTWEQGDYGTDALARLPDGTPLSIMFNYEYDHEGEPVIQVEFYRNNSQSVTGEGDAQRIFATVLSAIQQFIRDKHPKQITFAADKEEGPSRANLYKKLVERFARPLGYQVETYEAGTSLHFALTRKFGLRESELAESLRRELELFEEQDLFEIKMTGKNLSKLAKAIPGAMVGLEFEMIVPNAEIDNDGDMEPDYDQDERVRDIDDAVEFFDDGDYNSNRELARLRSAMEDDYQNWVMEGMDQSWHEDGFEYFQEWLDNNDPYDRDEGLEEAEDYVRENNPDIEPGTDEYQEAVSDRLNELEANYAVEQWEEQGRNYDYAREEYEDEQRDNYSESDWLSNQGIRYASDVESNYGHVTWPYYTTSGGDSEADIERIALDFMNDSGLPYNSVAVSSSYHGSYKKWVGNGWVSIGSNKPDDCFAIEPDGSLDGDNSSDAGLEFVSPPIPLDQIESVMEKVQNWAGNYGAYTGKHNKTSMHTNISIPGYSIENLDYLKAALLLGDEYVLREFDRIGNTYAKPAIEKIRQLVKSKPEKAQELLDKMKSHLNAEASKLIHSGTTDKFTSINTKGNRIEFRSPGGDYLDDIANNPKKMTDMINRMVVTLDAAMDPNKYKEEYQKKLYKLLTGQQFGREAETGVKQQEKKDTNDLLNIFSRYAAGELPKAALKSFVRQAQLQRKMAKGDTGGKKYWWNVQWDANRRIEVVAGSKEVAKQVAAEEWGVPEERLAGAVVTPLRPYNEPAYDKPTGDAETDALHRELGLQAPQSVRQASPTLNGRASNPDGNYVIVEPNNDNKPAYRFMASGLGDAITVLHQWEDANPGIEWSTRFDPDQSLGQPVQQSSSNHNWAIRNRNTNEVLKTFQADDYRQAFNVLQQYKIDNDIGPEDNTLTYGPYNRSESTPIPGSTLDLQRQRAAQQDQGNWGIWINANERFANQPGTYARGETPPLYRFPSQEAAESWLEQQRAARPNLRTDIEVREIEPARQPVGDIDLFPELNPTQQDNWSQDFERRMQNPAPVEPRTEFGAGTADAAQGGIVDVSGEQPAQGSFTGEWKVVDANGQELYRFSGVGNSQSDANRVAAQWAQRNMVRDEVNVIPVMS